ncbi:MAG: Rab family GTPase [Candidatus Thorarchaeota archaeon]|jgi:Ras-related protein Rab-11A/Ras-related protein Rab-11B
MTAPEPDFVHKLVLLGDTGVGKTSLVERYVYESLSSDMGRTIGAILHVKTVEFEGALHKLVIWDLGGQESFAALRHLFCANASGAFFVFDRSRPDTLENIDNWLDDLYTTSGNVPVVVVENKIDLKSKVNSKKIKRDMEERVLKFIQTSATENQNVNQAFGQLVTEINDAIKTGRIKA